MNYLLYGCSVVARCLPDLPSSQIPSSNCNRTTQHSRKHGYLRLHENLHNTPDIICTQGAVYYIVIEEK